MNAIHDSHKIKLRPKTEKDNKDFDSYLLGVSILTSNEKALYSCHMLHTAT